MTRREAPRARACATQSPPESRLAAHAVGAAGKVAARGAWYTCMRRMHGTPACGACERNAESGRLCSEWSGDRAIVRRVRAALYTDEATGAARKYTQLERTSLRGSQPACRQARLSGGRELEASSSFHRSRLTALRVEMHHHVRPVVPMCRGFQGVIDMNTISSTRHMAMGWMVCGNWQGSVGRISCVHSNKEQVHSLS